MSVTISDVASRAGVSTSTVSKVINNNPTISAETTARVNAAIKELHYIPNSRAVSFAKGQAKNIVYLSTLGKDIAYENPHMFDIMCGVYHELTSHHYMMSLVDTSEESYPGERAIVEILKFNLKRVGYDTLEALDGESGLELARTADPDLILLDVMLPKMNGFDICAALRAEGRVTPIIMLTAREEETDKVLGLEAGADDYVTKPFSMRELMARVKANIRRREFASVGHPVGEVLQAGALRLNVESFTVTKSGQPVELTQKEYDLLLHLMRQRGKVFTREDLMQKVWNYDYFGDMRTVDVTIRRLREKIEDDPGKPEFIMTKRGAGYYFAE